MTSKNKEPHEDQLTPICDNKDSYWRPPNIEKVWELARDLERRLQYLITEVDSLLYILKDDEELAERLESTRRVVSSIKKSNCTENKA